MHTPSSNATSYAIQLDAILSQPLTPEIINDYGQHALDKVVEFAGHVVADFKIQVMTASQHVGAAVEKSAFAYFGLRDIESVLDHLAIIVASINEISIRSQNVVEANRVILPPDKAKRAITPGNGSFEKPAIIPRLMTILFVLRHSFDVDIQDTGQVVLRKGVLKEEMVRKISYVLVDAAKLNRTILVCDEEGNATFVFDQRLLEQHSISIQDIEHHTKSELRQLLDEAPTVGRYIVCSSRFVVNVTVAIGQSFEAKNDKNTDHATTQFLHPAPPDGVLSIRGVAGRLGVNHGFVKKIVLELGSQLGEVRKYRFGLMVTGGYNPAQQDLIRHIVEERTSQRLGIEDAPKGFLNRSGIAKYLEVPESTVGRVVAQLGDELGAVSLYQYAAKNIVPGYSPAQQELIKARLESKGLLAQAAPANILSCKGMAKAWGVDTEVIRKTAARLDAVLGVIDRYKFEGGGHPALGYTQVQQAIIFQHLPGVSFADEAPDDFLSQRGLTSHLGVGLSTIRGAIAELGEKLGEVRTYRFGPLLTQGYSPAQQALIQVNLEAKGIFKRAPSDILPAYEMAKTWGISMTTVIKAAGQLRETLGQVEFYMFSNRRALGYTPAQQKLIYEHLRSLGLFVKRAPDGFLSRHGLAHHFAVQDYLVGDALEELSGKLGEIGVYQFGPQRVPGYSPVQQELIRMRLEANGALAQPPPSGVLSCYGMATKWDIRTEVVGKAIEQLRSKLGNVGLYKFRSSVVPGYTPDQQMIIRQHLGDHLKDES